MNTTDLTNRILDELRQTLHQVSGQSCAALADSILAARRIFVAGAGRSGLMVKGFAMRLMHLDLTAYVVGEMVTPSIGPGDLLVIASGSGATESLVSMAKKAKQIGSSIALVSIFPQSPIGSLADHTVHIPAPTPKGSGENNARSIQPMGTLFEQSLLLTLDMVILLLMEKKAADSSGMFALHANLE